MGKKSSKSTSTSTSTSSIDPQQRAMLNDVYNRAKSVIDQPYQAYGGQTLAGPNATQTQAYGMATDAATSNVGGATLNQAIQGTQAVAGYQPMQVNAGNSLGMVGSYMNPYLENVAGNVLSNLDRARTMTLQDNATKADAAHAFGGSRHGVIDAETNRNFFDTAGNQISQLFSQGYDTALGAANTDLNRSLTAQTTNATNAADAARLGLASSQQLAGLSDQQRQQAFGNAALLEGVGNTQQAQTQAALDDQYAKWLEAENYDRNNVGFLANIVNGMPSFGGTTSGTSTSTQPSSGFLGGLGSTLGAIGTGLSLFSPAGGAMAGAKALGGMLGISDENVKSGRKPVRDSEVLDAVEKMPVERWRYDPAKGGPDDGGVEHIGPMAQTMSKNLGIGNGQVIPMIDAMGANFAATKALAKKVRKLEGKGKKGAK